MVRSSIRRQLRRLIRAWLHTGMDAVAALVDCGREARAVREAATDFDHDLHLARLEAKILTTRQWLARRIDRPADLLLRRHGLKRLEGDSGQMALPI